MQEHSPSEWLPFCYFPLCLGEQLLMITLVIDVGGPVFCTLMARKVTIFPTPMTIPTVCYMIGSGTFVLLPVTDVYCLLYSLYR